jgi:hypothetical protein
MQISIILIEQLYKYNRTVDLTDYYIITNIVSTNIPYMSLNELSEDVSNI